VAPWPVQGLLRNSSDVGQKAFLDALKQIQMSWAPCGEPPKARGAPRPALRSLQAATYNARGLIDTSPLASAAAEASGEAGAARPGRATAFGGAGGSASVAHQPRGKPSTGFGLRRRRPHSRH
jgi:hypothetical protein